MAKKDQQLDEALPALAVPALATGARMAATRALPALANFGRNLIGKGVGKSGKALAGAARTGAASKARKTLAKQAAIGVGGHYAVKGALGPPKAGGMPKAENNNMNDKENQVDETVAFVPHAVRGLKAAGQAIKHGKGSIGKRLKGGKQAFGKATARSKAQSQVFGGQGGIFGKGAKSSKNQLARIAGKASRTAVGVGAVGAGVGAGVVGTGAILDARRKANNESTDISNFLKSLTEKNYAEANKYLHAVLDTKMKGRIRDTATN